MPSPFQNDAFQANAFQAQGTAAAGDAFQSGAFQFGAFQWAKNLPAFQSGAFQFGAFQCEAAQIIVPAPFIGLGGGWGYYQPSREERRKRIYDQRVALGILPPPVKRAIRAAVRKAVETAGPHKPLLVKELERREIVYQPVYLEAMNKLYAQAQEIAQSIEKQERTRKRHRSEEEIMLMLI